MKKLESFIILSILTLIFLCVSSNAQIASMIGVNDVGCVTNFNGKSTSVNSMTSTITHINGVSLGTEFTDDFSAGAIDTGKWTPTNSTDITIAQNSGRMKLTADASYAGSLNQAVVVAVPHFNFSCRDLVLRYPDGSTACAKIGTADGVATFPSGGTLVRIQDVANGNNYVAITMDQATYLIRRSNNGTNSDATSTSACTDYTWRISHISGQTNTWQLAAGTGCIDPHSGEIGPGNGNCGQVRLTPTSNWKPRDVIIYFSSYIYGTNQQNRVTQIDSLETSARK